MRSMSKQLLICGLAAASLSACKTAHNAQRAAASPCQDTRVTLYFEANSETLTDAGNQIVGLTAHRLNGCRVKELSLVGLADPTGSAAVNLTLSQHRADNVLEAFVKAGLAVPHYTLVAAGSKGAVAPNGAVEPVRRQVDVTVVIAR